MNKFFFSSFFFSVFLDILIYLHFLLTSLSLPPHSVCCSFRRVFSAPIGSDHHLPFHSWSWLKSKITRFALAKQFLLVATRFFYLLLTSVCSSNTTPFFILLSPFCSSSWDSSHHSASTTQQVRMGGFGLLCFLAQDCFCVVLSWSWASNGLHQTNQGVRTGTQESPFFSNPCFLINISKTIRSHLFLCMV